MRGVTVLDKKEMVSFLKDRKPKTALALKDKKVFLPSLDWYIDQLSKGEHFSLTRWGDGEFKCIKNPSIHKKNYSGHHYFPELGKELNEAFYKGIDQENHYIAVRYNVWSDFAPDEIKDLDIVWMSCDTFEAASNTGTLFPLVEQLSKMDMVVIGHKHLVAGARKLFGCNVIRTVEIPLRDCWLERDRIEKEILDIGEGSKDIVYAFSASMLSNVLISSLHDKLKGNWLIDFGSLWDPYIGFVSRQHHGKMIREGKLIKKNLGGR